jgi:FkbM family methyltransferase
MLTTDIDRIVDRGITMEMTAYPFTRVGIYGAGGRGRAVARRLKAQGVEVVCFFDGDAKKCGTRLDGLMVLGREDLRQQPELPLLIASFWREDILFELREGGLPNELFWMRLSNSYVPDFMELYGQDAENFHSLLADEESRLVYASVIKSVATGNAAYHRVSGYPQYRHPRALPRPGDVVVDGGAYSGDTAQMFLDVCAECHVHAFEPDPVVFARLEGNIAAQGLAGRVTPHRLGLWESSTRLSFTLTDGKGSHIDTLGGSQAIDTISLDEFAQKYGGRIDLLKLDVEGAEAAALRGAAGVIRKYRPRLQICLYHKALDCVELPLQVLELTGEGYRYFVGHHGSGETDTVLYAVPD